MLLPCCCHAVLCFREHFREIFTRRILTFDTNVPMSACALLASELSDTDNDNRQTLRTLLVSIASKCRAEP